MCENVFNQPDAIVICNSNHLIHSEPGLNEFYGITRVCVLRAVSEMCIILVSNVTKWNDIIAQSLMHVVETNDRFLLIDTSGSLIRFGLAELV